jgi:hypothetical protein
MLLALARAAILRSESCGTHDHIVLSQIRDSLNLEGQVPVFISPRNRVAQLCPQALGSLFVASYDSQDYGGGIRPNFILICTASYIAYQYPRKCLLITRIHGNVFCNELVSKNQSLRKSVCQLVS